MIFYDRCTIKNRLQKQREAKRHAMPRRDALTEDDVARMMDRAERAMASASRQQRSLGQDIERLLTERNRLLAIIAVLQSEDA
jgi:hypothetical protein